MAEISQFQTAEWRNLVRPTLEYGAYRPSPEASLAHELSKADLQEEDGHTTAY